MSMKIKLVIFDLDGTLVDSIDDLQSAMNVMLAKYGFLQKSRQDIENAIGTGALSLVEASLPENVRSNAKDYLPEFLSAYSACCTQKTYLLTGVQKTLEFLKGQYELAVLTNKPEGFSREILEHLNINSYFSRVIGGDTIPSRKPDPKGIQHLLSEFNVEENEALIIGDGVPDVRAAKNAGIRCIALMNGYGKRADLEELAPDYQCENMDEVLELFRS